MQNSLGRCFGVVGHCQGVAKWLLEDFWVDTCWLPTSLYDILVSIYLEPIFFTNISSSFWKTMRLNILQMLILCQLLTFFFFLQRNI